MTWTFIFGKSKRRMCSVFANNTAHSALACIDYLHLTENKAAPPRIIRLMQKTSLETERIEEKHQRGNNTDYGKSY